MTAEMIILNRYGRAPRKRVPLRCIGIVEHLGSDDFERVSASHMIDGLGEAVDGLSLCVGHVGVEKVKDVISAAAPNGQRRGRLDVCG